MKKERKISDKLFRECEELGPHWKGSLGETCFLLAQVMVQTECQRSLSSQAAKVPCVFFKTQLECLHFSELTQEQGTGRRKHVTWRRDHVAWRRKFRMLKKV